MRIPPERRTARDRYARTLCVICFSLDRTDNRRYPLQYFDYWHCIDKCAAKKLFAVLK